MVRATTTSSVPSNASWEAGLETQLGVPLAGLLSGICRMVAHRGRQEAVANVRPAQIDAQHRHRHHQQGSQAGAQAELRRLQ